MKLKYISIALLAIVATATLKIPFPAKADGSYTERLNVPLIKDSGPYYDTIYDYQTHAESWKSIWDHTGISDVQVQFYYNDPDECKHAVVDIVFEDPYLGHNDHVETIGIPDYTSHYYPYETDHRAIVYVKCCQCWECWYLNFWPGVFKIGYYTT